MALSVRYYVFPVEGAPLKLASRTVNGLTAGKDTIPEYSGTKQRVLGVVIDNEDGQAERLLRFEGVIWSFDAAGGIVDGLHESIGELFRLTRPLESGNVVSLKPELERKRFNEKHRWHPSEAEIELVVRDIWPKAPTDRLKAAKGSAPRKPKITYEAKRVLKEARDPFWKIAFQIDGLKEADLVGFAYETRSASMDSGYGALNAALADMADRRLAILRRRRSPRGDWFAFVEVVQTRDNIAEVISVDHRRCNGKKAAIQAGRELLARHAALLTDEVTLEAGVVTDLEWEARAKDSSDD